MTATMTLPSPTGLFTKREIQRYRRALYRAYMATHDLLAQIGLPEDLAHLAASPEALAAFRAQVAHNIRRAEFASRLAACLPESRQGRKARREAADNLSVALEVQEVLDLHA